MRHHLLSLLLTLLTPLTLADVRITYPAPGAAIPAGDLTVKWSDSGAKPALDSLESYTLKLMVGGNSVDDALQLVAIPGQFSEGNSATGTISEGLASSLKNGFYLQMISTAKEGGTIINYSSRFTITGLTGTTPSKYTAAVSKLGGTTSGPDTINEVSNQVRNAADPPVVAPVPAAPAVAPAVAPVAPAPAAPVEDPQWDVPYNLQTGLTRYAPMQPIPPTKITAKKVKPLYPTSAFTIAKTRMSDATVLSTMTQEATWSVQSRANTAAPQPGPSGDLAKFLARWKD